MSDYARGLKPRSLDRGVGSFGIFEAHDYLSILAKGLKYIIPRKDWDFQGTLNYRRNITHDNLSHMEEVFRKFNSGKMNEDNTETACLRDLVGYNKGLTRKHCKRRTRKARISRLRDWTISQIIQLSRDREQKKGIVYFSGTIKKTFLDQEG